MEEKTRVSESSDSHTTSSESNALGLDVGTSRIVLAQGTNGQQSSSHLNAFLAVPFSKMTETILQQNKMSYYRNGKDLYIYGNDSERFASVFNAIPRRPMQQGVLNAQEVMGQQIIKSILERVLPRSRKNALLYFSVPGSGEGTGTNLVYHEAVLKSILQSLGYEAKAINEGLAVVFAELQDENFTGIGISCGGGMCNVCVSYMSVPVVTFSLPKAGDFIDTNAASVVAETPTSVRLFKEESLDLSRQPKDKISVALNIYYEDVLQSLITRLSEEFEGAHNIPKIERPLPIVLSGGTAKPRGFVQKFEAMLKASNLSVPIADVRLASDPLTATARGCYIAAMSEAQ